MSSQFDADCVLVDEFRNAVSSLFNSYITTVNSPSSETSDNLKVSTFMKISISSADQEVRLTLDGPITDEPALPTTSSSSSFECLDEKVEQNVLSDSFSAISEDNIGQKVIISKKKKKNCHLYEEAKEKSKLKRTQRSRSSLKNFYFLSDLQTHHQCSSSNKHRYFFHIIYLNCLVKDCTVKVNTMKKLNEHLLGYHQIDQFRCPHKSCQMSFSKK